MVWQQTGAAHHGAIWRKCRPVWSAKLVQSSVDIFKISEGMPSDGGTRTPISDRKQSLSGVVHMQFEVEDKL